MKCHYEYKGQNYDNIIDLYPIILGEMESTESVIIIENSTTSTAIDASVSPIKEVSFIPYKDKVDTFVLDEEDKNIAKTSIESGEFIEGKDVMTKLGKLTVKNYDERTDQLFTLFNKIDESFLPIKITKDKLIELVAQNMAYEKYIQSTINDQVIPVNTNEYVVPIPYELEKFMAHDVETDSIEGVEISKQVLSKMQEFGFDPTLSGLENFRNSLETAILVTSNPIQKYTAQKMLDSLSRFGNIELIADTNLSSRGRTTIRNTNEGSITSIRINPNLITDNASYVQTILEELTHAIVYQELRTDSENVTRLKELHQQVIANYGGQAKLNSDNFIMNNLNDINNKLKAGFSITEEEAAYMEIHSGGVNNRLVYRLNSFDEFIAGVLTDGNFQDYLNNLSEIGTSKTLWQKFIDIIAKIAIKFGLKQDGALKYALNDSLMILSDGLKKPSFIGESLNGKYSRSKTFINNKLGLKDANNNLKTISNATEVVNFINSNLNNMVAIQNDNGTVQLYYRDELKKSELDAIDSYLNSYDPAGDTIFGYDTSTPEFLTLYDASGWFDDDTSQRDTLKEFNQQAKVYLVNLNDRRRSLYQSKKLLEENDNGFTIEKANKLAFLEKEIEVINEYIKRLTTNQEGRLKGLVDLYYQGKDELDKISQMNQSDLNSSDIKYALQTVKFWKDSKKLIFRPQDYADVPIRKLYDELETEATKKLEAVTKLLDNYVLEKVVKKHTKFDGTVNDLAKEFVDLSQFRSLIDDLGVTNSTLLNSIASEIKTQNEIRQVELTKKLKHFKDITAQALPSLKNYGADKDIYEIFRQVDSFGRNTRNIVTRQSSEYQKARKPLLFVYDNNSSKTKEDAFNATLFLYNNTEKVNYRALFPELDEINQEEYDKEVNRLKSIMGSKYFTEWYANQSKKLQSYKKYKEYKITHILDTYNLTNEEEIKNHQEASNALSIFNETSNPFMLQDKLDKFDGTSNPFTLNYNYQSFKYIEDIPKKSISINQKGKMVEVNGYDSKFEQIEKDDAIYNYYNEIITILKEINTLIPYETGERIATNGLPEFKLEMYDLMMDKQFKAGKDAFTESMYDLIRTEKYENQNKEIDIITGKEKERLSIGVSNSNSKINDELMLRTLKYKIENKMIVSEEMLEDWRSEITEKYANEMDFDLSKVMQRYIILGMAYKHKAIIEDSLNLSQLMFNGLKEYKRDNKGELIKDITNTNAITYMMKDEQDSFINSKKMLDHSIKSILYGKSREIDSGKKKILTPVEKRHKKILEDTIKEAKAAFEEGTLPQKDYEFGIERLQNQIDSLGAYSDKQKYIDLPIRWTQYKGMGWNLLGGISNMVFGHASNLIESAGAEFYTGEQLAKAYGKVFLNSTVRNYTFNKVNRPEAMKIRSLMDNFDIMAESGREYASLMGKDITERLKWLSAFNVNARTEYINQAPLMIVMLENSKFEHNGKEYNLYEAFNNEGEWNTEEFGAYPKEQVRKTILKIKALIQRNHGNYNPMAPMLAKRSAWGRLLFQFRTWMVDGYRTRLFDRNARYDHILETHIKGRYNSAYDVFREDWKGASIGTALQVIKNFIPYSNRFLKNWTPLEKQLEGNDNIKDYDIANMRRLAMEMNIFIGMYTVITTLSLLAGDWDDDDPRKWAANLILNQGSRLRTDILMYINPSEAEKLIQDPIPSMRILTDFSKFKQAVEKTMLEGSPEYETGIYQGHNRMLRTGLNMIPFGSQYYRIGSGIGQVYDDK